MMSSECAQNFQTFKRLVDACEVYVFARSSGTFLDCWKYFCAQPAPTPPHWWRFSTKTEPNQPVLDLLPTNLEGSQLWHHHHDKNDEEKQIFPIQTPPPAPRWENLPPRRPSSCSLPPDRLASPMEKFHTHSFFLLTRAQPRQSNGVSDPSFCVGLGTYASIMVACLGYYLGDVQIR